MVFLKNKKLIIALVVVISTILLSFAGLGVYNYIQKNQHNELNAFAAFGGGSGTESDPYIINGSSHLKRLATDVNNGETYRGKYFRLNKNINFAYDNRDENFDGIGVKGDSTYNRQYAFEGYFNGYGYTISNFVIQSPKDKILYDTQSEYEWYAHGCGFFAALAGNAQVYNLKLSNFTLKVNAYDARLSASTGVGGIAGCVLGEQMTNGTAHNVQISKCAVSDMTVELVSRDDLNTAIFIGGLVGYCANDKGQWDKQVYLKMNIDNCYVENFLISDKLSVKFTPGNGNDFIGAFIGAAWNEEGTKISNCVLGGVNYSQITLANGWYPETISQENVYVNQKITSTSQLTSCDSRGGTSGTVWYYHSAYNNGYPRLRVFIDWMYVYFDSGSDVTLTFSPTNSQKRVEIPSDADPYVLNNSTSSTINFYGQQVTATAKSCVEFQKWVCDKFSSGNYQYSPLTKKSTFKLKIVVPENVLATFTNAESNVEYTVNCGLAVDVYYGKEYEKIGYASLTLKFTDTSGEVRYVNFSAKAGFYIEKSNVADSGSDYVFIHKEDNIRELTVVARQKEYNSTIS